MLSVTGTDMGLPLNKVDDAGAAPDHSLFSSLVQQALADIAAPSDWRGFDRRIAARAIHQFNRRCAAVSRYQSNG